MAVFQFLLGFDVLLSSLDAPLRMGLAAVGVFSLARVDSKKLSVATVSVIFGTIGVAAWAWLSTNYSSFSYGLSPGRAWNGFSNPIPFGVLSVMLGFLAVLLPLEKFGFS